MRITYVTSADRMDEIHGEFDAPIERVRGRFGQTHPMLIGGNAGDRERGRLPTSARSIRASCSATSRRATGTHADQAVAAARRAFGVWGRLPWRERVAPMRRLADAIRGDRWDLSALMGFECGKNRMECLGDVEESADLIDYYCDQIEQADGFVRPMQPLGPAEHNSQRAPSVRRLGGHLAVQLPARARGGSGRRGAGRRQHRGDQAGNDDAVDRAALRRARARCRPAATAR